MATPITSVFKRCVIILCGSAAWVNYGDGRWHDLGKLQGDELIAWCVERRLPIIRASVALQSSSPAPAKLSRDCAARQRRASLV